MPPEKLVARAILAYDGDDAPFHIRGPHSRTVYAIRKGCRVEMCLADAETLCGLKGFSIIS